MPIDYNSPDWQARLQARRELRARLATKAADLAGPRSRPHRWSITRLDALYDAQKGKCANSGCRESIPKYGRGRAIDLVLNVILCKACSIALGNARRSRNVLLGLARLISKGAST